MFRNLAGRRRQKKERKENNNPYEIWEDWWKTIQEPEEEDLREKESKKAGEVEKATPLEKSGEN